MSAATDQGEHHFVIGPRNADPDVPVELAPPLESADVSVRRSIVVLAVGVAALFPIALVSGWLPLFYVHFVAQFMMVLYTGKILWRDHRIPTGEKLLWSAGFLLLAPVFVPLFAFRQL